tara:strand:+ start:486 stop:752 length:267 start_codon:yes stop_codon:yes gene_type:complete
MANLTTVLKEIAKMDSTEVNATVDAIKLRRNFIARSKMLNFQVGDVVYFDAHGGVVQGNIVKKARKNLTVDTGKGKWRVASTLLRKTA